MTRNAVEPRIVYAGNGSADDFNLVDDTSEPIYFRDNSDIVILERDDDGNVTTLVEGSDYDLTGGPDNGVATRTDGALPSGYKWSIRRQSELSQETDIASVGAWSAARVVIADMFDRTIEQLQEVNDKAERALKLDYFDVAYDATSKKIINVASGTLSHHAVNYGQLQTATIDGVFDFLGLDVLTVYDGGDLLLLYDVSEEEFKQITTANFIAEIIADGGLTIGEDVQAWDTHLDQIAALTPTDNNIIVGNGTAWVAESGATARTSLGITTGATDNAVLRADGAGGSTLQSSGVLIDDSHNLCPVTSDAGGLGTALLMWADAFFASGAVINFNNGDLTLTHAADTLTLAGGSLVLPSAGLTVGASVPFSDSAGTLTLQNVDALDATTEATIEAAIDTLANLTSIQGHTVTLTGAFIRAGAHSLTLTTTATTDVTLPTTGTLATLAGVETFTNKTLTAPSLTGTVALASGLVFNWNSGDLTLTHSADTLTLVGGSLVLPSAGLTVGASVPFSDSAGTLTLQNIDAIDTTTRDTLEAALELAFDTLDSLTSIVVTNTVNTARFINNADSASVQVARFEGDRASMADNDEAYLSFMLSNDAGTQTEMGRFTWVATDVNVATSVDSQLEWDVAIAGTLTRALVLNGTNLASGTNDLIALGVSGTAFADLFLASGGVINWNAGNATLTHSAGLLTTNVPLTITGLATAGGFSPTETTAAGNRMYLPAANTLGWSINGSGELQLTATALSPITNDGQALGVASTNMWADAFFASGAVLNFNNGDVTVTHATNALAFAGASSGYTFDAAVLPSANDIGALGASGQAFADLFLADGGVINFDAGTATITHVGASNSLTIAADTGNALGSTLITFALDGANELHISSAALYPASDDGLALGIVSTNQWADLFLATGGVINWANSDVTVTHSANLLAFAGSTGGYTFDNLAIVGHTTSLAVGGTARNLQVWGTTAATGGLSLGVASATAGTAAALDFYRSKNAAIGTATVVASGDSLGAISWYGAQQTGTFATQTLGAQIRAEVDGTVTSGAAGDMPGRIVFSTTADGGATVTDRLILDAAGILKPNANDGVALGTGALSYADLFLASGAVVNFNNGDVTLTHSADTLTLAGGTLVVPASGLQVGASNPFSDSAGTLTLQNVDALDATTEATIEAAIDTLANLVSVQGHTVTLTGAFVRSGAHSLTLTTTATTTLTLPTTGTLATLAGTETLSAKTLTSPIITTAPTAAGATWTDLGTVTTADINGGTIDGVVIGGASAAAATVTTLTVNTNANPDANDGAGLGTGALGWSDLFLASGAVINWNNGDVTVTHAADTLAFAGAASGYSFDAVVTVSGLITTSATISANLSLTGDISPTQLTANQNDYNPTGLSTASVLRLSADASRSISGLAGGADGRVLFIHNVGSNDIVLLNNGLDSSAANRFAMPQNLTVTENMLVVLMYDATSSRWRAVGGGTGGGSSGPPVSVSATAPVGPDDGDLWFDTAVGGLYVYINDGDTAQWIEASTGVAEGTPSGYDELRLATTLLGLQTADNAGAALIFGDRMYDSFDALTYVDTAGATNLDSATAGLLKPSLNGLDSFVVLLLHFNGADGATTTTDSSNSAHAVTFVNGAQLDTAQSKFGTASLLCGDGVDDYVYMEDSADWAFGTGDFTIDFWIKRAAVSGSQENMFGQGNSGLTGGYHSGLISSSVASPAHTFRFGMNDETFNASGPASALNNTNWNHIAIVRSGNNLAVAVNGSWGSNVNVTGQTYTNTATRLAIGQTGEFTGGSSFNGWVDEFRVSKGIARWTPQVSFTSPTTEYSNTANNLTVASTAFTAAVAPASMRAVIRVKEVDAAVANTDYTLEFSRDNGTTYTAATLTEDFTSPSPTASIRVCKTADVDVSGQPSGTSVKWRFKTLNNDSVELHDVALEWAA